MADPEERAVSETRVFFSVKELFLDLKSDLKRIEGKLEHAASATDVIALTRRVVELETTKASTDAVDKYKKWQYGIVAAIAIDVIVQVAKTFKLLPA